MWNISNLFHQEVPIVIFFWASGKRSIKKFAQYQFFQVSMNVHPLQQTTWNSFDA